MTVSHSKLAEKSAENLPLTPSAKILPNLGLVCITASNEVRYRALTRKRLLQLELPQQIEVLQQLYRDNLARLNNAIDYCQKNEICLYRLTSALFPFADTDLGAEILTSMAAEVLETGKRALEIGIRLVVHPDQFVVLSSDKPEVIQNSIKILEMHARNMDLLGQPVSPWATMEIHGGKSDRASRLITVIRDLPDNIRLRLALENDEYAYNAEEILEVCRATGVVMVFDAHHHIIHEQVPDYEHYSVAQMKAAARTTWPDPNWQMVHISNGKDSFHDPHHSDYIYSMPTAFNNVPWIEVEAKLKEEAIQRLKTEWLSTLP